ncbi:MAG: class I SAM-dependent methyltransferase [Bacteroidota bacterium]|nr:class I SAM-dependent methyltransferase [Bacteroidota bacterium]
METNKEHWEKIYSINKSSDVSWWQENPKTSLDFVHSFYLHKTASIIDIGGGDSKLVDCLLDEGFENITVLDISQQALNKAKQRLGDKSKIVRWIVSDITEFEPSMDYELWHDRATFHFLLTEKQIRKYLSLANDYIKGNGYMTIGTFSETGPDKCSGLDIRKYSEKELQHQLENGFKKIRCIHEDHITPFNTTQNFIFCSFRKRI